MKCLSSIQGRFLLVRLASEALGAQLPPSNAYVGVNTNISREKSPRKRLIKTSDGLNPPPSTLAEEVRGLAGAWALLHGRGRRHGVHVAKKQGCDPGTSYRRVPIDLL